MKKILNPIGYAAIAGMLFFTACKNNTSETTEQTSDSTNAMAGDSMANNNAMTTNNNDNKDADFVKDVVKANAEELQMLASGKKNGTDATLKADARKMEADHKKLATTMMDYASKNNITIDTSDMDHDDMSDKTKGKDWDKDWADKMEDGHKKTIDKFESNQNDVKDSTLKNIITTTLPTLHKHLDMVKALQDKLNK